MCLESGTVPANRLPAVRKSGGRRWSAPPLGDGLVTQKRCYVIAARPGPTRSSNIESIARSPRCGIVRPSRPWNWRKVKVSVTVLMISGDVDHAVQRKIEFGPSIPPVGGSISRSLVFGDASLPGQQSSERGSLGLLAPRNQRRARVIIGVLGPKRS